ncbi:MAG: radical SAM family heme chaperone HemW [Bacilli bacterium]|nr:radical SAM family heme chaperone HemW [Bacilli bacterium]
MKSVYIHIPFCNTICTYCDFCKFYYNKKWVSDYLNSLEKEIKANYKGEMIKTLYIGGGTPSSLSIEELEKLFSIIEIFDKSKCIEFTFECNIENLTEEKANFLIEHGVNRLSIGVETFHEKYLTFLNRHHKIKEVEEKINYLKKIGFRNINIDLIYALPNQTIEEVREDVAYFLKLEIPHISVYSLMIEDNTILSIQKVEEIEEDLDARMYENIEQILTKNGYIHYEISNFGKKGFFSEHNLVYWNNEEYYGFGVGASGYIDKVRYDNTRNIINYIKGDYIIESHKLSQNEIIENEFILGFRKLDGINLTKFYQKYHRKITDYSIIKKLLKEEKLVIMAGNIKIEDEYIYISNQILYQLLGEKYE